MLLLCLNFQPSLITVDFNIHFIYGGHYFWGEIAIFIIQANLIFLSEDLGSLNSQRRERRSPESNNFKVQTLDVIKLYCKGCLKILSLSISSK